MELMPISKRGGRSLRDTYSSPHRPGTELSRAEMLDLLNVLAEAEHAPVWAYTSHSMLLLAGEDDAGSWLVTAVCYRKEWMESHRFRITFALPDPWYAGVGFADTAADAAALVLAGLDQAAPSKRRNVTLE
jgi:hypothetical protein